MKTILAPIYDGMITKNILRTDVFKILSAQKDLRIILLVPKLKKDFFEKAYQLYSLFWGLNLKLVDIGEVKKIDDNQIDKKDDDKKGIMAKLGKAVKYAINCCKE